MPRPTPRRGESCSSSTSCPTTKFWNGFASKAIEEWNTWSESREADFPAEASRPSPLLTINGAVLSKVARLPDGRPSGNNPLLSEIQAAQHRVILSIEL